MPNSTSLWRHWFLTWLELGKMIPIFSGKIFYFRSILKVLMGSCCQREATSSKSIFAFSKSVWKIFPFRKITLKYDVIGIMISLWYYLYYRERLYFFSEVWFSFLDGKLKMIILKKYIKICHFSCMIGKDDVFFLKNELS